jgi:hypothetical protein
MEYGSPQELLKDSESEFTKLVNELKEWKWPKEKWNSAHKKV